MDGPVIRMQTNCGWSSNRSAIITKNWADEFHTSKTPLNLQAVWGHKAIILSILAISINFDCPTTSNGFPKQNVKTQMQPLVFYSITSCFDNPVLSPTPVVYLCFRKNRNGWPKNDSLWFRRRVPISLFHQMDPQQTSVEPQMRQNDEPCFFIIENMFFVLIELKPCVFIIKTMLFNHWNDEPSWLCFGNRSFGLPRTQPERVSWRNCT